MIDRFRGKYEFLSNMYPSTLYVDGERYPSAEHAFQALKCANEDDRIAVSLCRSSKEARQAGRLVEMRPDWEEVKTTIMYNIVEAKFFGNPQLAQKLKDTGKEILVEGNTWGDTFWGSCRGKGQNTLGQILMEVRRKLND